MSLFFAITSFAQVTSLEQFGNDKVYTLESKRCFLMYNTKANATGISTSTATNLGTDVVAQDAGDVNQQFKIEQIDGNYYLYSVGAAKYVTKDGSFADGPVDVLGIKESGDATYNWMLTIGGNGLNSQEPGQMAAGIVVNDWTTEDEGNCYRIIDVEPADVPASGTLNETAVFDFTYNAWGIPTYEETNYSGVRSAVDFVNDNMDVVTIDPTANSGNFYYGDGYLRIAKPGSKIVLPAFGFAVEKIEVVGHPGASDYKNVDMNVYVGGTAVSTTCVGSTATNTFEIAAENRAAGNIYELVIGSKGGNYSSVMYITYIKVYPAENKLEAPAISLASGVYTGTQTVNVKSPTADIEGVTDVTYYYTLDGNEPSTEDEECDGTITIDESCTLKVVVELTYAGVTYVSASSSAEYIISEEVTYTKASAAGAGKYFIVANGNVSAPIEGTTLPVKATSINGDKVTEAEYYAVTIEHADGGYLIKDVNNDYIYTSAMYTDRLFSGKYPMGYWTIALADDESKSAVICSNDNLVLVYDTAVNAFVVCPADNVVATAVYPTLYVGGLELEGIKPADGAVVESLETITVTFSNDITLDETKEIALVGDDGTKVAVKAWASDNELIITVDEALYNGEYVLTIAEGAVKDASGNVNAAITATYEVEYAMDTMVPSLITPADGEVVESLKVITIDFAPETPGRLIDHMAIYVTNEAGDTVTTANMAYNNENWTAIDVVLAEEVAKAGTFTVTIPASAVWNTMWQNAGGRYNPEIVLTYTVEESAPSPVIDLTKIYRIKDTTTGCYLHVGAYNASNQGGPVGSVMVTEYADSGDQVFSIEEAGNGQYYLKSLFGHYIVCRPWNVDACDDGQKTELGFEFISDTEFYITNANGYFKVEFVSGAYYPFCDAGIGLAAAWVLEEAAVPTGIDAVGVGKAKEIIYDLTGRKIDAVTAKGIYIVNGKKVLVK